MKYLRKNGVLVPVFEPDEPKPVIIEPPFSAKSPEETPQAPIEGTLPSGYPILYATNSEFFSGLPPMSSVIERYNKILTKAKKRKELKEVVRHLGTRDRFFFMVWVLERRDAMKEFVYKMCRFVEYFGENDKGDFWSREHYKTSIKVEAGVLQKLAADPTRTFALFGYTKSISSPFLMQLKLAMEQNKKLPLYWDDVFWESPASQSPLWSMRDGLILKGHPGVKEPNIEAHGVTKNQPTGIHVTDAIYDDMVDKESASTKTMTEQTINAWQLSLNLVNTERIERTYQGTFYSYGDAYQHMIKTGAIEPRIAPCTVDGTEDGEPVLWTKEQIAEKRRTYGAYNFACQCLLDPLKKSKRTFRFEWLKYWDGVNLKNLEVYILVDPAGEKKSNSDYTAICVFGYGADRIARVIALLQDKLSLTERTRLIFELKMKYNAKAVYYEKYGKDSDIEHIKYVQEEKKYSFPIFELGGKLAKEDRILRLIPWFEFGRLLLPYRFLWEDSTKETVDFVDIFIKDQYTKFPFRVTQHDDLFDVLSRIPDVRLQKADYEKAEDDFDDYVKGEDYNPKELKWSDIA